MVRLVYSRGGLPVRSTKPYKFCAAVRRLGMAGRAKWLSSPMGLMLSSELCTKPRARGQVRRAALLLRLTEQAQDVVHDAMVELDSWWDTIVQLRVPEQSGAQPLS